MRRLMVAVAIVAVAISWAEESKRRSVQFFNLACEHVMQSMTSGDYHDRMQMKYWWASRYSWLPVAPDPPEPE
jgi:hypothetical protein